MHPPGSDYTKIRWQSIQDSFNATIAFSMRKLPRDVAGGGGTECSLMLSGGCALLVLRGADPNGPGHTLKQRGSPSSSASKTTDFKNIWWSHSSEFKYFSSLAWGTQKMNPNNNNNTGAHVRLQLSSRTRGSCSSCARMSSRATGWMSLLLLDPPAHCCEITEAESNRAAWGVNYESRSYYFHYLLRGKYESCSVVRNGIRRRV